MYMDKPHKKVLFLREAYITDDIVLSTEEIKQFFQQIDTPKII